MCVCMHVYVHTCVCACTCMYVCVCVCVSARVCVYLYCNSVHCDWLIVSHIVVTSLLVWFQMASGGMVSKLRGRE